MRKDNEVLLTDEVYTSIIEKTVREILELKKQQGETLDSISASKEVLKKLKVELLKTKRAIKSSKKNLREEQRKLSKINNDLSIRNSVLMRTNSEFLLGEERYINPQDFNFGEVLKQR